MRLIIIIVAGLAISLEASARELTAEQKIGMYRHGNWEWSLRMCSGIIRNKRYWNFLKDGGQFENTRQITDNEGGQVFENGWQYMQRKAEVFGNNYACDYAMEKWPAMLWRKKKQ